MTTADTHIINRIGCLHLCAFVASLPFDRFYSELILISYSLYVLVNMREKRLLFLLTKELLITSSLFLLALAGMCYSPYPEEAKNDIGKQMALILFPFLFALGHLNLKKYYGIILYSLPLSCTAVILYLYLHTFRIMIYYQLPIKKLLSVSFINHNFSAPLEMHATMLSMYVALSIFVLLDNLYKKRSRKLLHVTGIIILCAGLVQLGSKSVIISTLIIANLIFPLMARLKRKHLFIIASILLSTATLFEVARLDSLRDRFITSLHDDLTQSSINNEIIEPRIKRWEIATSLIKGAPVWGYGTGSEIPTLKTAYFKNKLYNAYLKEMNTHNEYLSLALKYGIAGVMVYLFVLGFGIFVAYHQRNFIFLSFLVIVIVVSTAENLLDVNKGIFFFSFFYNFFIFHQAKAQATSLPESIRFNKQPVFLNPRSNMKETMH